MKKTFKTLTAIVLAIVMLLALTACAAKTTTPQESKKEATEETTETEKEEVDGGWDSTQSMEITDEIRAMVEQATANMVGAKYTPVAYIGRQIVNGTNHRILCKIAPVTPDAVETYAIVTIYEDLEGNVEITEIQNSEAEAIGGGPLGGWTEELGVTEASTAALDKAMESWTGASFKQITCLGTQIVSGTNYCLLCEITPVVPNAESHFGIVIIYEDLEGNATVSDVFDFIAE